MLERLLVTRLILLVTPIIPVNKSYLDYLKCIILHISTHFLCHIVSVSHHHSNR